MIKLKLSTKLKLDKHSKTVIDPALLFQHLLVVANASPIDTNKVFSYELCSYPPAIFESHSMLRKADKPKIVDSSVKHVMLTDPEITNVRKNGSVKYILDGGSLLYRLSWEKNSSYIDIANAYALFVKSKYGEAIVIFDGYILGPKDNTHLRRCTKGESRNEVAR